MRLVMRNPVDNWEKLKIGRKYIWLESGIDTVVRVLRKKEDGDWFGVTLEVIKSKHDQLHKKGDTFDVGYRRGYEHYQVGEFYKDGAVAKI
ncbi:hypothetical protein [Bacillus amyloliquefaciens]|uniref:hypothetical protein n=1 Tax=Bacillus amyloliquefaciens TaxID=1390 RepID=UPI001ABE0302|nr:hypothetical protein [Bacillus amyloliquefaciens]QTG87213.1 hypothetical protein J4048_21360 [Bacillus amyloliquefaciens]